MPCAHAIYQNLTESQALNRSTCINLVINVCSLGEYDGRLIFYFPQNGKIMSDEKPFREPQFPRLPVSYLATLLS